MALIPPDLKLALSPLLKSIRALSEQIDHCDEQIAHLADKKYPETKLLRQVQGIGPLISLTYVLTLDDPYQFARSRTGRELSGTEPETARIR